MKIFGLDVSSENIDCLPPKIWRAVMLWIYGLPVTPYIVRDIGATPAHEITDIISAELQESPAGIIVRTIATDDRKKAPYFWIKEKAQIQDVVKVVFQESQPYLMAFSPKTTPAKASGFAVGRYLLGENDSRVLEFVADAIEPRKLEVLSIGSANYSLITKGEGHFFKVVKAPDKELYRAILGELLRHEDNLGLLKEYILREKSSSCVCFEFTWNGHRLEFHDFDY